MLYLFLQAVSTPTYLTSLSLHRLLRNQFLPAVSTPTGGVYSYLSGLPQSTQSTQEPASTCCVYSYWLCLLLPAWPPAVYTVYPGTSFYLLCLLLLAVSTPTCLASLSLHSLPRNQLLPAESTPTCCVYSYLPGLLQSTQSTQEPASTC